VDDPALAGPTLTCTTLRSGAATGRPQTAHLSA
jgi:hypothetical protein